MLHGEQTTSDRKTHPGARYAALRLGAAVEALEKVREVRGGDAGTMTRHDVHGELPALTSGRLSGRSTADEIFVFDSTGTALQDVAAAVLVYTSAIAAGIGLSVPLGRR